MTILTLAISPKTPADANRLAEGLRCLTSQDPTLDAMNERQLEVAVERLAREFYVNAGVGRPQVVYLEAVTRTAEGEMKYSSRDGGGEYAHVKVRGRPRFLPRATRSTRRPASCSNRSCGWGWTFRPSARKPSSRISAPRKPAPTLRRSGIALPEPEDSDPDP